MTDSTMSNSWVNFIASIDPVALEAERMRVHGNLEHERPGSRWDYEMKAAHDWLKRERAKPRASRHEARVMQVEDADQFTRDHGGTVHIPGYRKPVVTDEELDKRFAAYRAARKAA